MPHNECLTIALLWNDSELTELRKGLLRYLRMHQLPWRVPSYAFDEQVATAVETGEVDALVLRRITSDADLSILGSDLPTVVCGPVVPPAPRRVAAWFDDAAVGRFAARHLLERGYRSFACQTAHFPEKISAYRRIREQAFMDEVARHGHACITRDHLDPTQRSRAQQHDWLRSLPEETGIFTHEDHGARFIAQDLQTVGRDDIGLVGAGDFVHSSSIGLSSVRLSWSLLGFEVGRTLHVALSGNLPDPVVVPPLGVVERESSARPTASWLDGLRTWVHAAPQEHRSVAALCRYTGLSRATLNRRFRREVGMPVRDWLREVRLQAVRHALAACPDETVDAIARRHGWCDGAHLIRDFRPAFGITPGVLQAAFR